MKKIFLSAFIVLLLSASAAIAQQTPITKPNYDLAERFSPKKINRMVHSQIVSPSWFENSDKFWYGWKNSDGMNYFIVDPVSKSKSAIFDLDDLAMQLTEIVKDPFDAQHIPFSDLKLKNDKIFTFSINSTLEVEKKIKEKKGKKGEADTNKKADFHKKRPEMEKKVFHFEYDYTTKKLTDVSDKEQEKKFPNWASISPDSNYVVYGKGCNLYYTDMANLRKIMEDEKDSTIVEHKLTTDGKKSFSYTSSMYNDYEEEKDTLKRVGSYILWSPDSKHFVIEKTDLSQTKDLWVINALAEPRPKLETYKYQMPGEPSPKSYLMVFNMDTKNSKVINVDEFKDQSISIERKPYSNKDRYAKFVPTVWFGTNEMFYMTRLSRDFHRADICTVNINEDSAKVVIRERMNTYIDVCDYKVVNSGKEIIMMSERNGWSQLYLHSSDGTLKNPITKGAFHVKRILEIDEPARVIYFTANGVNKNENPYYNHTYRINFDGSNMKLLDPGDFDNKSYMSDDAKFFVSSSSRVDVAPTNVLYDNVGRKIMDLETADFSQLLLAGYKFPEIFKVKAADGITDLYGVMYKPFDFDSTKLYPIIEYVYPGPQTEATNYSWSKGMNRVDRLAQMGFIVITVGNRGGHPDRSKWYHSFGYGNLRDYGLEDQKVAVQQLAARYKYIDINKVGVHGHSGGGFMSTAAILTYPDFYKVAVSCAGNHDNSIYNRWWSEIHHGIKEVVSEKGDTTFNYSIKTNQELAKNLKGRLLLVHGDIDNNVHPANTTRVVNALIKANKRFEMLYLPGQRHGFGDMDEYFFWRMADFYSRYLIENFENTVDIPEMNND